MQATHIRLDLADRDDAAALLLPIAGTVFGLTPSFETTATTSTGRVYVVQQSIAEIEEALGSLLLLPESE